MRTMTRMLTAARLAAALVLLAACGADVGGGDPAELPAVMRVTATRAGEAPSAPCVNDDPWAFRIMGADEGMPIMTGMGWAPRTCEMGSADAGWTILCEERSVDEINPGRLFNEFTIAIDDDLSGGTIANHGYGVAPDMCDVAFTFVIEVVE
jgi:hypothetical protein